MKGIRTSSVKSNAWVKGRGCLLHHTNSASESSRETCLEGRDSTC